jgi:tryptophan synthase alpha subunit
VPEALASRFEQAVRPSAGGLPGLIPYVTAGFPSLDDTPEVLLAAERAGCVAAEVGIPFSDPLADGPTIQRSSFVALQHGMTPELALEHVRRARDAGLSIPVAVMTYLNPVLARGVQRFAEDACAAGVDGVIVPDLPWDEAAPVRDVLLNTELALIPLVAPTTTTSRLQRICAAASGFVYCVGVTGVTGARPSVSDEAVRLLDAVRECTSLPRALGFGLASHDHLRVLVGHAEGAVVGSALIDALDHDPSDAGATAEAFLRGMIGGT